MKTLLIGLGIVLGALVVLAVLFLAILNLGREVVVVREPSPSGAIRSTRLWVVDQDGHSWIHPANPNGQWWAQHLAPDAMVEVERNGVTARYRATPDPAAHAEVHRLMREKYGAADELVRWMAGTDTRSGIFTHGQPCAVVPIRLERVG